MTPPAATIRRLTPKDADALLTMFHHCSPRTRTLFSPINNFYTTRGVQWLLYELEASTYVAATDAGIVGLAYLREDRCVAYLALVVADPYQRQGVGTELLNVLEAEATQRGDISLATAGGTHVQGMLRPLLLRRGYRDVAPIGDTTRTMMVKPLSPPPTTR